MDSVEDNMKKMHNKIRIMLGENKETMETRHPNPWEDAIDTVRVCTIIVYACNSGDGEVGVFCFGYIYELELSTSSKAS